MTDEQIVKALECCVSSTGGDACRGCPYEEEGVCVTDGLALQRDSLDLIKRQQAEIEKTADYKKLYEELKTEHLEMIRGIKNCRAEAIREFAEMLKAGASRIQIGGKYEYKMVTTNYIDYLVKKMTEKEGADNA